MANIFQMGRLTNFKPGTQMDHEDPYHRQAQWPPWLMVKVARSRGPDDKCWPISRKRKVTETPKMVRRLITPRAITRTRFEDKRPKVKINAKTENVSPTSYGLQNR